MLAITFLAIEKKMVTFLRINFLLLLLSTPLTTQAYTQNNHSKESTLTAMTSSGLIAKVQISKQMAAGIAQQTVPGRVLKVTLKGSTYRVKIISQSGDVVNVLINANTGQILNQ